MYLDILKKDLKRKKTMNLILLILIILAATFIAGSINNMVSVMNALDSYFEKAKVPDYWVCTSSSKEADKVITTAEKKADKVLSQNIYQMETKDIQVNGDQMDYDQTIVVSDLNDTNTIFTGDDEELTEIKEGELYASALLMNAKDAPLKEGDRITLQFGDRKKTFTVKGKEKDALYGSPMMGITRLIISERDYRELFAEEKTAMQSILVYTEHTEAIQKQLTEENVNMIFNADKETVSMMYVMDMVVAAVMLIISVCLILISMVLLRFTIQFTMSEEFREIGVMKAIGIKNPKIRMLYIIKYFMISLVGGGIGFFFSIPFSKLMLARLSRNIIISTEGKYIINVVCAAGIVIVVLLFCYLCTRKIKRISPIVAIRNGENGERYQKKGLMRLHKNFLAPVLFMALNDILSGFRRFVSMVIIFTLGLLLLIIPVNTINTLKADSIISMFSMAPCDHVIAQEVVFQEEEVLDRESLEKELDELQEKLKQKGIKADVYREVTFRMPVSNGNKSYSSLAFQGVGDVTADDYSYLEGTPPENIHEIGLSHIVADKIGVTIGDRVKINIGNEIREYTITAIFQTMNNMGEGIRFSEEEQLDYQYLSGGFGIQVKYMDHPDKAELEKREKVLDKIFPKNDVYTSGEYINQMIGDIAGQIESVKQLILIVVLAVNVLVALLMVKSFITREKGEIAMLKAIGFRNSRLILWQTLRIGIVLLISNVICMLIATPLSEVSSGQVFQMMGAEAIQFEIVPFEVFVMYPLIVFAATILSGFLAALQIRKVSAAETANVE